MTEDQGRVLLVDDDRQTRLKLARDLEGGGFAVSQADGGRAALDMLQYEPFDLVLLDILMPEVDGYAVLSEMKADEAMRDIPVVVYKKYAVLIFSHRLLRIAGSRPTLGTGTRASRCRPGIL